MTPEERTRAFNAERAAQLRRLVRIQGDTIAEILRQLEVARVSIAAQLVRVSDGIKRQRLEEMQREIASAMRLFEAKAREAGSDAAARAWSAGGELTSAPLAAGGIAFAPRLLDSSALSAMNVALTHLISDVSATTINRINAALAQVIIGTMPASDAISAIQRLLGAARNRAKTIVYTELGRIYAAAAQSGMEDAAQRLPGIRKRWIKSGKRHPRPEHVAAHGQLRPVAEPFDIAGEQLMFPRDPNASAKNTINCGCLSIPVTDGSTWGASTVRLDQRQAGSDVSLERRSPAMQQAADGVLATVAAAAIEQWEQAALGGLAAPLARALVPLERDLAQRSVEWAYVLDDAGNTVFRKRGSRDRVPLAGLSLQEARGLVLTHNHPDNAPPSIFDVFAAAGYDLAELRVVGPTSRYRVLPPLSGWRLVDLVAQENELRRFARGVLDRLKQEGAAESSYDGTIAARLLEELVRRGLIRLQSSFAP